MKNYYGFRAEIDIEALAEFKEKAIKKAKEDNTPFDEIIDISFKIDGEEYQFTTQEFLSLLSHENIN